MAQGGGGGRDVGRFSRCRLLCSPAGSLPVPLSPAPRSGWQGAEMGLGMGGNGLAFPSPATYLPTCRNQAALPCGHALITGDDTWLIMMMMMMMMMMMGISLVPWMDRVRILVFPSHPVPSRLSSLSFLFVQRAQARAFCPPPMPWVIAWCHGCCCCLPHLVACGGRV